MGLQLQPASTSQFVLVNMRSSTTGQLLTGIAYGSITVSYWRPGAAAPVAESSITDGTLGSYSAKTWKEYSTSGRYQYCPSNAAMAVGVPYVDLLFTATGAIDKVERIWLQSIVTGIAPGTSGGIPTLNSDLTVSARNAYSPRTYFVSKTGNDANPGTYASPKLTIASALTAASGEFKDTIRVGEGTWTEQVDITTAEKSVALIGKNNVETILTRSGTSSDTSGGADHVIKAWHGCDFSDLNIVQSATGTAAGQGIRGIDCQGVSVERCYIESNYDCVYFSGGRDIRIANNYMVGHYDCTNVEDIIGGQIVGNYMSTNCAATFSDSMRCIILAGAINVNIEDNHLTTFRNSSVSASDATYGVHGGSNSIYFRNNYISATQASAGISGNVSAIHGVSGANNVLDGVNLVTSNAGSGTTRHLRLGNFTDVGSNVDTTLIHATSTTWIPVRNDTRKWLGTAAATPTVAGIPKVENAAGNSGTGARTVTITVNDGSTVLQSAIVRMTEGANSYTATTDVSGVATFNLDDATYTVSISKAGYSYAGTTLIVNGTETATYSMTQVTYSTPSDPAKTTAYLTTYNGQGTVEGSVVVSFKMEDGVGTSGYSYNQKTFTATSNASTGLLEIELVKSTQYSARRGNGEWVDFTTGTGSSYALPEVLGTP